MTQINKNEREKNIKRASRLEDLKPAKEKITPKIVPRNNNKPQEVTEQANNLYNTVTTQSFQAAKHASIAAIMNAKNLTDSSEQTSDQDAINQIESFSLGVISDTTDIALDTHNSIRRQIRKKHPSIKNTKDIKTSTRTIRKADKAIKSSTESTQIAIKSTIEASKQAAIVSQKVATAKKAEQLSKKAAESVKKIIKGIIKAIKKLFSALEVASVPLMLIIVLASTIAALVASAFGIFFTGDVSGESTKTLQEVALEINQGYNNYIEEIKASVTHDNLVIEGYGASWSDVIAVYAVFMTTKSDGATDVVHMTEEHEKVLYDIFWTMNSVTYTTEEVTVTEKVPDLDADGNQKKDTEGNLLYIEQEKTTITLHIALDHVTAQQEADVLYFNEEQKAELNELLDPKNASLWAQLLKGMGLSSSELANLALSQLGNEGGEKFWKWAGLDKRCPWCALFVSWCGDQLGLLSSGKMPYFSFVGDGMTWFQGKGQWISGSDVNSSNYEKVIYPGMIIFFDWLEDGIRDGGGDHVGIVTKVENGYIYTVEGNRGDAVAEGCYPVGSDDILGFGIVV